jgi:hypothetical protein
VGAFASNLMNAAAILRIKTAEKLVSLALGVPKQRNSSLAEVDYEVVDLVKEKQRTYVRRSPLLLFENSNLIVKKFT